MKGRVLSCLALLCLSVWLAQASETYPFGAEFVGSEYGDMIDTVRRRMLRSSHRHDEADPGQIGRMRGLLEKIKADLTREQVSADRMYARILSEYGTRSKALNESLITNKKWLATADARSKWYTNREVNLTIWLKLAPKKIVAKKGEVANLTAKINHGQTYRNAANARFRTRETNMKQAITSINNLLVELGVTLKTPEAKKSLKDALNAVKQHASVVSNILSKVTKLKKGTVDQLKKILTDLKVKYHEMLTLLSKTEQKWSVQWQNVKKRLDGQLAIAKKQLKFLVDSVPKSKKEIILSGKKVQDIARLRPVKLEAVLRDTNSLKRLRQTHLPLVNQYLKHKKQRVAQLADVASLLDYIHRRYDGNNLDQLKPPTPPKKKK